MNKYRRNIVIYVLSMMWHVCIFLLGGKAYGQLKDAQLQSLEEINEVYNCVPNTYFQCLNTSLINVIVH